MAEHSVNLWGNAEHAAQYLERADTIPHRHEGESALVEWLPPSPRRLLDLGSGDGRLLALAAEAVEPGSAVALDFSPAMLARLEQRFAASSRITVVSHDMAQPLPASLGRFDVVISSFAIHHLTHDRKQTLYGEVFAALDPDGVFANLEHVASATLDLHHRFLTCLGVRPEDEDPSNKLLDVETQLTWLRDIGFVDVDCHWKWRELALLVGHRSASPDRACGSME